MATLLSASLGEHERALGGWQAEFVTILDEVFSLEAIVAELTPVLDEALAGITRDAELLIGLARPWPAALWQDQPMR